MTLYCTYLVVVCVELLNKVLLKKRSNAHPCLFPNYRNEKYVDVTLVKETQDASIQIVNIPGIRL